MSPRQTSIDPGEICEKNDKLSDAHEGPFLDADTKNVTGAVKGVAHRIVNTGTRTTRKFVYNILTFLLTLTLILGVSIFTYGTFYFAYMPTEVHAEEINFQFEPCEMSPGPCSFLNTTLQIIPKKHRLMIGQPYRIALTLELPESVANQDLGMFMSCLSVNGINGNSIETSCKSSILEFKSNLLRTLETLVFSPFLLTGTTSQRQWINIVFFQDFYNDPSNLASNIHIQIKSQFIQIYSSQLHIQAELSGLRYIMHHHPWISSLSGIIANIAVLTIIILISWTRFFSPDDEVLKEQIEIHGSKKDEKRENPRIETLVESHQKNR